MSQMPFFWMTPPDPKNPNDPQMSSFTAWVLLIAMLVFAILTVIGFLCD